jgi:hypothetical protein
VTEGTRLVGLTSRRCLMRVQSRRLYAFSRVPPSSLEGCDVGAVREWAAQCHRVDTGLPAQLPHSAGDGRTARAGGTAPGYDSQAVSEGRRGWDSRLTRAPAACQSI